MASAAREYIDFWIENSVHAAEQYGNPGGSQNVTDLVRRFLEGAKAQGISEDEITDEVGDLIQYIRGRLATLNKAEKDRRQ